MFKKNPVVRYIIAMQEAFVAMLPFFLYSSILVLLFYSLKYVDASSLFPFLKLGKFRIFMRVFNEFTSLVAVTAIAFFLARRMNTSQIIAIQLSVAVFITAILFNRTKYPLILPYGFSIEVLYAPIVSTFLLHKLYPYFSLRLPQVSQMGGSRHVYRLMDYLLVFVVAYFAAVLPYLVLSCAVKEGILRFKTSTFKLPETLSFFIRDLIAQIFWFFGIHGQRIVNAIAGKEILSHELVKNLTYAEFNRLFINVGGTGAGLSLLLALFVTAKDKVFSYLAKISTPFVMFNINSLLIYPLVVLNEYLLVPFLAVPALNFAAGYVFVKLTAVQWSSIHIPWTTPPFINIYLKSSGNLWAVSFQLFLLSVDSIFYFYYLRKFFKSQSIENFASALKENLNIRESIESDFGIKSFITEKKIIEATIQLEKLIPSLKEENLLVYYQPKVSLKDWTCNSYEALLRYRHKGKVLGPFFLREIERAGLAPILDIWVSRQVKSQIELWKKEGFTPEISVNIHPDTLLDSRAVDLIIEALRGEKIKIEVVERGFYLGDVALKNLQKFQDAGFGISIDDFGIGYSNLEVFIKFIIQEIKIDKTIIDTIETSKGYVTCKKLIELCQEEGYTVVAEGVETEKQCSILKEMGADYIQGFYFAPALPPDEAKRFAEVQSSQEKKSC